MAERLRKLHQDEIRAKIQGTQLLNRLSAHALGKIELRHTQIRAINILLNKVLPDLQTIEHTGEGGGPLASVTRIELVAIQPAIPARNTDAAEGQASGPDPVLLDVKRTH